MASLVKTSAAFDALGYALTSQSHVEQVNGLVEVALEYVTLPSNISAFGAKFYVNSEPPLYPDCIAKSELLTNRLYMVSRDVKQANGLVTVSVRYVSGLRRPGFVGYYQRIEREMKTSPLPGEGVSVGGLTVLKDQKYAQYTYVFEYVEIGGKAAVQQLPTITIGDLRPDYGKQLRAFAAGNPLLNLEIALWQETQRANVSYAYNYITPTVRIVEERYTVD